MASDLPYLPASGNITKILDKIRTAGTPPRFNSEFLKTLGFTSSQDRGMPKILKALGFLNSDNTPNQRYNDYKNATTGGLVLAQGLRDGWSALFLANQEVHKLTAPEISEICKSVTGQGESATKKMAATFKALASKADWSVGPVPDESAQQEDAPPPVSVDIATDSPASTRGVSLHHDVHVHLPPTSDVAVYRAIFRALREELMS